MTYNTIDWRNRTYYCGNCASPRPIDAQFCAAQCGECGDDETYLASENPFETPIRIIEPIKVVFLDIDGVMNSGASIQEVKRIRERCPNFPESNDRLNSPISIWRWFAPWSVEALNHITDVTGAQIVISSTWRTTAIPWLRRYGVRGHIIGRTPYLDYEQGRIFVGQTRGREIAEWFAEWETTPGNCPVYSFVILDDDADMGELLPRLIQTEGDRRGLTMEHARSAVEMLGEEVQYPR